MTANFVKSASVGFASALSAGIFSASAMASDEPPRERLIFISVEAPVSIEEAWRMWTTREGLESFFSREAHIDPRVDGNFSIYFYPDRPPGLRGAENMRILSFEPMKRLSFSWNAPVELAYARMQRTVVTVRFEEMSDKQTRVSVVHNHFGDGVEWDRTIDYFVDGWSRQVMPYFMYAAENGGVEWGEMDVERIEATVIR